MRKFLLVGAVGAHVLLSACNLLGIHRAESGESDTKAADATTNSSGERQAEKAAEPTENGSAPTARTETAEPSANRNDWLAGRWGDANCQQTLEFANGGEFRTAQGTGRWSIEGTTLTVSGDNGERTMEVERLDDGGIVLHDPETGQVELTRC